MCFKRLWFILWFALVFSTAGMTQNDLGMRFRSYESPIAERTTLHLSPDAPIKLNDVLEVSFAVSMWRTSELGYLLRFSTEDLKNRIDLLYKPGEEGGSDGIFKLSINGQEQGLELQIPYEKLVRNRWLNCEVKIDKPNQTVSLTIDDQSSSLQSDIIGDMNELNPVFGRSPFSLPSSVATPRFGIKNLSLQFDQKTHNWPLQKQEGERLSSEDRGWNLEAQNPEWIADLHTYWQQRFTQDANPIPGLSFDPKKAEVYIVDESLISIYNLVSQTVTEFRPTNSFPKDQGTQAALYSTRQEQLYGYNLAPVKGYAFNKTNATWENNPQGEAPPIYIWQHTPFENALNGNAMIFAGYGFFTARNSLLELDPVTQEWAEIPLEGDLPEPRFMHGITSGFRPGEYFVYGGYGNESGDQELGFQNLNDLYLLNLNDSSISKLWADAPGSTQYLPSSSMVLSVEDSSLYAIGHDYLSGSKALELLKISIGEPKVEVVELKEKLPFEIRNIGDYNLFLYYAQQTNELVSVLRLNTDETHAEVRIHTMAFPPVSAEAQPLIQRGEALKIYLMGISGGVIMLVIIWYLRKRAKKEEEVPIEAIPDSTGFATQKHPIKVLSGFKLTDQEGNDITAKLSPKLKELFLLILLHSVGKRKGISTKKLTDILWPGIASTSAKNNRGVSLQKLRQALKALPQIEVIFSESKWEVGLETHTTCDLEHAFNLMQNGDTEQAVGILSGPLLPGTSYEWLDAIKVDVHHDLIQQLMSQIEEQRTKTDWVKVVKFSRCVLSIDPVHDDALRHLLKALVALKKVGQAKSAYEQFSERYRHLYNEAYPIGFEEILE